MLCYHWGVKDQKKKVKKKKFVYPQPLDWCMGYTLYGPIYFCASFFFKLPSDVYINAHSVNALINRNLENEMLLFIDKVVLINKILYINTVF